MVLKWSYFYNVFRAVTSASNAPYGLILESMTKLLYIFFKNLDTIG